MKNPGTEPGHAPDAADADLARRREEISAIYRSATLDEATKERLIAALLPGEEDAETPAAGRLGAALAASLLVPGAGLLIGAHLLLRHGDETRRPALACLALGLLSLGLAAWLVRGWVAGLAAAGS